jgi:diguanylate cyclase (GGDEF)-like protein
MSSRPQPVRRSDATRHQDSILQAIPFGLCAVDSAFVVTFANRRFADLLSHSQPGRIAGLPLTSVPGLSSSAELTTKLVELALNSTFHRELPEARVIFPNEKQYSVRCEAVPEGGWLYLISPVAKPAPDAGSARSKHLNEVISNLPHAFSMYGPDERLLIFNAQYVNDYALDRSIAKRGARYADILAHSIERGNQPDMSAADYYAKRMRENRDSRSALAYSQLWNGRTMQITTRPLPDGGWVSLHEDVTEKLEANKRIAYLANHDTLTNLPNRNTFHARVSTVLAEIECEERCAAILFMDLDRFKQVNDNLGHMIGDKLLVDVADRLRAAVGSDDLIARVGGDEFVILHDCATAQSVDELARRLVTEVSRPFQIDGKLIDVGLSVGIALAPGDGKTSDTLLRNADAALYCSKSRGGGGYCFYHPIET